jgi:hypothetical protein
VVLYLDNDRGGLAALLRSRRCHWEGWRGLVGRRRLPACPTRTTRGARWILMHFRTFLYTYATKNINVSSEKQFYFFYTWMHKLRTCTSMHGSGLIIIILILHELEQQEWEKEEGHTGNWSPCDRGDAAGSGLTPGMAATWPKMRARRRSVIFDIANGLM